VLADGTRRRVAGCGAGWGDGRRVQQLFALVPHPAQPLYLVRWDVVGVLSFEHGRCKKRRTTGLCFAALKWWVCVCVCVQALVDANAFVTVSQVYCGLVPPTEPPDDLQDDEDEAVEMGTEGGEGAAATTTAEEEPSASVEHATMVEHEPIHT
jgi:hypothetical protein